MALFLDEIGELPPSAQTKLLRVLQEREVVRLGSRQAIPVDVRLIAATNVRLEEAVAAGKFREDLYFRLAVARLVVEPLRQRPGDILPLARHFISAYASRRAKTWRGEKVPVLSPEAERCLLNHDWAGNIRELENTLQHALLVCSGEQIRPADLDLVLLRPREFPTNPAPSSSESPAPMPALATVAPQEALKRALLNLYAEGAPKLWDTIEELVMVTAYQHSRKNQLRTARLLGISRNVVRARLVQFGVATVNKVASEPPRRLHPPPSKRVIDVWHSRSGSATASSLAIRKNWLQSELSRDGILVHSLRSAENEQLRNAHYHHQQTGLFREGGNIPPIWARSSGQSTAVVAITWLDEYQGILALRGSGIQQVGDLKGKRLALPLVQNNLVDYQRATALHGFVSALGAAGLQLRDARCVDVPVTWHRGIPVQAVQRASKEEVDALLVGRVDAVFVRGGNGARLARDPRLRQVINIHHLPHPLQRVNNGTPRPITVDQAFLEKYPHIVARYLSVLLRAATWAKTRPQEVLELIATELGQNLSLEDVIASNGPDVHHSFMPRLSPLYVRGLSTQKDFLLEHGFIPKDFDINNWIVPGPLAEAESLAKDAPELADEPAHALAG